MELKSLQDWLIAKYMKSVPDVVDDSSFGGITREYQVKVNPDKLIAYGLNLAHDRNTNWPTPTLTEAEKFYRAGIAADQCARVGLIRTAEDVKETILKTQNGTRFA